MPVHSFQSFDVRASPAPRQLEDPVLQSAQDAVLGAGAPSVAEGGETHTAMSPTTLAWRQTLAHQVARRPWRYALLAATAGALAMVLARRAWQQRTSHARAGYR